MTRPILLLLALTAAAQAAEPRVAVFDEPGFPAYGGMPALPSFKLVETLARWGVAAKALDAKALADPAVFNTTAFSVLVLPTGNAYPQPALANLRAFKAAGGALVLNGVPFCHKCERDGTGWKDVGHVDAFGHRPDQLGTGGFAGPHAEGTRPRLAVPTNPLGLPETLFAGREQRCQWLDRRSLGTDDEVIPLVTVGAVRGEAQPAAALIRHHCPEFKGAVDAWLGQIASGGQELDHFLAEQLLARATLWCLHEKGELAEPAMTATFTRLDKLPLPGPLPGHLPYVEQPRPWGDTYLPRSKPPARTILTIDATRLTIPERIAVTCLQGLTSREQPRLWLNGEPLDKTWLAWHQQKGHLDTIQPVDDWTTLFKQYGAAIRGVVVPDDQLYRGDLLALNVAACEDMIVAPPALAERLGLPVKIDLRGKHATYAEGLRWLWATYKDRLSHHLADYMHPQKMRGGIFGYDYEWRALMVWICGPVDERQPGADRFAEYRAFAEILAETAPNTGVLGFPYAGEGVGPGEGDGVALISRYGKGLVCTDFLRNLSISSGVQIERLTQPVQPAAPKLERDKIYIAMNLSDGDNENTWRGFMRRYFDHPTFGQYPFAFGMGPAILEIQPAIAQWYYEHASPQTEFFADVSGVSYTSPPDYGTAYADREQVVAGFLAWSAKLMPKLGMRTARTVGGPDSEIRRYIHALPFCHSIFADMGRYSGREGIKHLTYTLDGMPVFRSVTSWRYGKDGFLREIREQVGTQRPAFVNGFVHCWTFGPEELAKIVAQKDADMVFVTPTQLAALYRESQR